MTMADLLELLDELRDFLNDQADADIDYNGNLKPNQAMRLMCSVEQTYENLERFGIVEAAE